MPQDSLLGETTCDKILRFLSDWQKGYFTNFLYGDPEEISFDELPCIVVDLLSSDVEQGATGMDKVVERITVKIILNKRDYLSDDGDKTVTWKKKLELLVQGANPLNRQYEEHTLMGVLRKQLTLEGYLVQNKVSIRFGEVPRDDEERTGEAHTIFTVERLLETLEKV